MFTTSLYRPGAHTSNLRSTSSTTVRTAIPIAHYRILSKEQLAELLGSWRSARAA